MSQVQCAWGTRLCHQSKVHGAPTCVFSPSYKGYLLVSQVQCVWGTHLCHKSRVCGVPSCISSLWTVMCPLVLPVHGAWHGMPACMTSPACMGCQVVSAVHGLWCTSSCWQSTMRGVSTCIGSPWTVMYQLVSAVHHMLASFINQLMTSRSLPRYAIWVSHHLWNTINLSTDIYMSASWLAHTGGRVLLESRSPIVCSLIKNVALYCLSM